MIFVTTFVDKKFPVVELDFPGFVRVSGFSAVVETSPGVEYVDTPCSEVLLVLPGLEIVAGLSTVVEDETTRGP